MSINDSIHDKVVLITGASQGIGRSIALAFAAHEPRAIILFARSEERLLKVTEEILSTFSKIKIKIVIRSVDVGSSPAVVEAVKSALTESKESQIDILVNNAGLALGAPRSFPELSIEEIDTMLNTNIHGYVYVTHAVLNAGGMLRANKGTILNVSSTTALEAPPFPGEAMYHTSKAAQEGFTNVLRNELSGTNIRVLALRPGVVANTNFHEERVGFEEGKELYDDFMKGIEPLEPDSIGNAAVWMVSQPESISVKALDVIPTSQRSLTVFDRDWNKRNGKEDIKMETSKKEEK